MEVARGFRLFLTNVLKLDVVSRELVLTRLPLALRLTFWYFVYFWFVLVLVSVVVLLVCFFGGGEVEKHGIFQLSLLTHASYL